MRNVVSILGIVLLLAVPVQAYDHVATARPRATYIAAGGDASVVCEIRASVVGLGIGRGGVCFNLGFERDVLSFSLDVNDFTGKTIGAHYRYTMTQVCSYGSCGYAGGTEEITVLEGRFCDSTTVNPTTMVEGHSGWSYRKRLYVWVEQAVSPLWCGTNAGVGTYGSVQLEYTYGYNDPCTWFCGL